MLEVALAALVLLKAVDVALIGPRLLAPALAVALTGLLVLGSVTVLAVPFVERRLSASRRGSDIGRARLAPTGTRPARIAQLGWLLIAAAVAVMLAGPLYRNHVFFLAWVTVILALFGDRAHRRLLLTTHLSVVYTFAAITKLNPLWLSGESLASWGARLFGVSVIAAAIATVVVEAVLAVAVWRPNRGVVVIATGMHLAFIVGVAGGPYSLLRLVVFNGASIALWWALWRERQRNADPVLAPLRR